MQIQRALWIIGIDILLFGALFVWLPFTKEANLGICILAFVGILWVSEAVHTTITALIVPLLAVLFELQDVTNALKTFANPVIFLFFGGFALASALHIQGLDRLIANRLILLAKGKMGVAILMLFGVSALLSMWISNTATAAIMLPLALGILSNLEISKHRGTFLFVLLGVAYSSEIGGFGTMVGSPPNIIAASYLGMNFLEWMKLGIPFMCIMLPCMVGILYLLLKPNLNQTFHLKLEKTQWDSKKIITLVIFGITALAWIFSAKLSEWFGGIKDLDSMIALACAVAIGITRVATWKEIQSNTDWGVLWLFGGGLALSAILKDSGASAVLANGVTALFGHSNWLMIILASALFIIFLTEFTSNTASSALLVPIFGVVGDALGMPHSVLPLVIGFGASCAYMLPVATPPNAIVYGTGYIKQTEMMKYGAFVNLFSIVLILVFAWFVWRFV
ncbi:DASS family sodium-coupled anion symporter [Helicobacter sp. MIT 05-5294]|uniref:SLC13 family permease n=1 Tax=Helicobacter sp. MIT 05-5294 TaxID=1548150 RepID=UPI0010FDB385|nr:DASS family sodium-coupled anion symporter [Helicobacter sp. MIT 05-5294]TLD88593.1 DASS family sodium-coupled anion symporter [Helicobacter sp. MIT 05-5294]